MKHLFCLILAISLFIMPVKKYGESHAASYVGNNFLKTVTSTFLDCGPPSSLLYGRIYPMTVHGFLKPLGAIAAMPFVAGPMTKLDSYTDRMMLPGGNFFNRKNTAYAFFKKYSLGMKYDLGQGETYNDLVTNMMITLNRNVEIARKSPEGVGRDLAIYTMTIRGGLRTAIWMAQQAFAKQEDPRQIFQSFLLVIKAIEHVTNPANYPPNERKRVFTDTMVRAFKAGELFIVTKGVEGDATQQHFAMNYTELMGDLQSTLLAINESLANKNLQNNVLDDLKKAVSILQTLGLRVGYRSKEEADKIINNWQIWLDQYSSDAMVPETNTPLTEVNIETIERYPYNIVENFGKF